MSFEHLENVLSWMVFKSDEHLSNALIPIDVIESGSSSLTRTLCGWTFAISVSNENEIVVTQLLMLM